jgi:hypothetical protein
MPLNLVYATTPMIEAASTRMAITLNSGTTVVPWTFTESAPPGTVNLIVVDEELSDTFS